MSELMSELMSETNKDMLLSEANRCLKCKVAKCQKACPISTDIPTIMNLFLAGKEQEAGAVLFENNPLSAICSIVCPHENNCNGNCILGMKKSPVDFYKIEQYLSGKYVCENEMARPEKNGMKIAVIGAGPAGISMSILMARQGFDVTLMEAQDKIGGVLRYGIPAFRLPKEKVDAYREVLRTLGVTVKPNCHIGSNLLLEDMFIDGYDAIFLAVLSVFWRMKLIKSAKRWKNVLSLTGKIRPINVRLSRRMRLGICRCIIFVRCRLGTSGQTPFAVKNLKFKLERYYNTPGRQSNTISGTRAILVYPEISAVSLQGWQGC